MTRRKGTGGRNALGRFPALVVVALLVALGWWLQEGRQDAAGAPPPQATAEATPTLLPQASLPAFLPPEARATLAFIKGGGPFPHPQDGGVFGNREGHLPQRERGFYREYTVETPGLAHRGARRIVTGGRPPRVYYYTDDHYDSFRRFEPMP
jgi:guanyl-specific ribonuclease Sa